MWIRLLDTMLRRAIRTGQLTLTYPDGSTRIYGSPGWHEITVRLADPGVVRRLCQRPVMALGEGYMDGAIEVAPDDVFALIQMLSRNWVSGGAPGRVSAAMRVRVALRGVVLRNTPGLARRNVSHHYDLSDDLYRLFLDDDMQYSCAYFATPEMSLEAAQRAKKRHIAAKLRLEPGMRVLDIGCGWGGMALTLARDYGVEVTGVTLSENQKATAERRAAEAGVAERVRIELSDYRDLSARFDRIVSVGMLEHVGTPQFDTYFGRVHDLMTEEGVALIHTIGRSAPPSPTSPWIAKYIFPGGYVPSLSDLAPPMERAGLWLADLEVLRGHYGPTLRQWRERFEAARERIEGMYDARFVRMWRFYLAASESAFEEQHQAVFQMQLTRRQYAVPVTRDYLHSDEARAVAMRQAAG